MGRVVLVEAMPVFPMGASPTLTVVAHPANVGDGTVDGLAVRPVSMGFALPEEGIYGAKRIGPLSFAVQYPDGTSPGTAVLESPYTSTILDPPLDFTIHQGATPFALGDRFYFQIDRDVPLPSVVRVEVGAGNVGDGIVALPSARADARSGYYVLTCTATVPLEFGVMSPDGRTLASYVPSLTSHGVYRTDEVQCVVFDGATPWAVGDTFRVLVDNSLRVSHGAERPIWRGVEWLARLETGLRFDVEAFRGSIGLGGASVPGAGTIRVRIGDGRAAEFAGGFYDGRPVRAWLGTEAANGTSTGLTQILEATAIEAPYDRGVLTLVLRDFAERLNVPIQHRLYTGGGGITGGVELANRPLPLCYGDVRVVAPVFVSAPEIYQVHDGEVTSIEPEDGGVPFTAANGGANDVADLVLQPVVPATGYTVVASGTANTIVINRATSTGSEWPATTGSLVGRTVELYEANIVRPPMTTTTCTAYVVAGSLATVTLAAGHDPPYSAQWRARVLAGDSAALEEWTPVAGEYITDLARGFFRLGAPPGLALTAHVVTPLLTGAAIVRDAAIRSGALAETELDDAGLAAFDALTASLTCGLFLTEPTMIAALLDQVTASLGALWTFTPAGQLTLRQVAIEAASAIVIPARAVTRCERVRTQLPVGELHLRIGRNYRPLTREQVGASVTNPAPFLGPFYAETIAQDAFARTQRLLARTITVETVLAWSVDVAAQTEAQRQLAVLSNTDATAARRYGRDLYDLDVTGSQFALALGDTVQWTFAPPDREGVAQVQFGLENRLGVVLGIREATDGEITTLRVWG